MNKRVLVATAVYDRKSKPKIAVPCQSKILFGYIKNEGYGSKKKPVIDFGKKGYWHLKDFVYLSPEDLMNNNLHDLVDYGFHYRKFAEEHGVYLMLVKIHKMPVKKIK
jgi:hypothetical protein